MSLRGDRHGNGMIEAEPGESGGGGWSRWSTMENVSNGLHFANRACRAQPLSASQHSLGVDLAAAAGSSQLQSGELPVSLSGWIEQSNNSIEVRSIVGE
jgi:hypothetical protein